MNLSVCIVFKIQFQRGEHLGVLGFEFVALGCGLRRGGYQAGVGSLCLWIFTFYIDVNCIRIAIGFAADDSD